MNFRVLFLLAAFSLSASAQNWSSFLDPSRAIDWTSGVGFTIPTYSTACATQPTLQTGSSNASANATAIQNALASCDATHNVVNLPPGTYSVTNWTYGSQGQQVVRGAGPNSTYLYMTGGGEACTGDGGAICMLGSPGYYDGGSAILPPSGSNQCAWTGGLTQGSTTITLSSCGGTPPVNQTIILDQGNDASDTSGILVCDTFSSGLDCTYKGQVSQDNVGRIIGGVDHSQQQVAYVTGVTSLGGGSYTVTITPGVSFTNIRPGQSPGAWWPGFVQNDGIENLTLDYSQSTGGATNAAAITMVSCYQCWVRNIRSIDAARNHVFILQSMQDVVRDSYFYQSQAHSSVSYTVESIESSGFLVENNIMQQVTNPIMLGQGAGAVVGYNFGIDDIYTPSPSYAAGSYASHNAGNNMDLWEGNNLLGIWVDDAWGSSDQTTLFRNSLTGWQSGKTSSTLPVLIRSWSRAYNLVGNVLGQPNYHTVYQVYATSATGGVGGGDESTTIYSIGWAGTGATCGSPNCDPLTYSTLMRWGNWDVVNNATQWNSTEASPAAVPYVNANFTSSYFSTLAQTLPASLYYKSTPSWWPSGKAWPPIGPDISAGNVGTCSSGSSYPGAQATASSQCAGGTLSSAWASHVTSIPAQDCYLNVMGGPPDGSGSVLSFDANTCYHGSSGTQPAPPSGLKATVN